MLKSVAKQPIANRSPPNHDTAIRRTAKALQPLIDDYVNGRNVGEGGIENLLSYFKAQYLPGATLKTEITFVKRFNQIRAKRRLSQPVMMDALRLALKSRKTVAKVNVTAQEDTVQYLPEENALSGLAVKERMRLDREKDVRFLRKMKTVK